MCVMQTVFFLNVYIKSTENMGYFSNNTANKVNL